MKLQLNVRNIHCLIKYKRIAMFMRCPRKAEVEWIKSGKPIPVLEPYYEVPGINQPCYAADNPSEDIMMNCELKEASEMPLEYARLYVSIEKGCTSSDFKPNGCNSVIVRLIEDK